MIFKIYEDKPSLGKAPPRKPPPQFAALSPRTAVPASSPQAPLRNSNFSPRSIVEPGIDWKKIELFHLDEYIGLPMTHPASFCKFLSDCLIFQDRNYATPSFER